MKQIIILIFSLCLMSGCVEIPNMVYNQHNIGLNTNGNNFLNLNGSHISTGKSGIFYDDGNIAVNKKLIKYKNSFISNNKVCIGHLCLN